MNRLINRSYYSKMMIFFILLGLLSGLYLLWQRHQVEMGQHQIENIVNYDTVLRQASFERKSTDKVFEELKDAGVTAFAIYDQTLQKLADEGAVVVLRSSDVNGVLFMDGNHMAKDGATYVLPVNGRVAEFEETREALVQRLGADKVVTRNTSRGTLIELMQPYSDLLKLNLSISRVQAQTIIHKGFNVIVRPTSYAGVTQEDVKFTFKRLEGLPNITGMAFVGKDVLGFPDHIVYLVNSLNSMRIPMVGIEATDQLQYDPQNGYLQAARMMEYRTGRLFTIGDDYLKKILPDEVAQQFYISDIERNVRYNLLPIYEKGFLNMSPLEASISYMKILKEKQLERGFTLGRASIYPAYHPSPLPTFLTMMGAMALFFFTFELIFPMHKRTQLFFFLLSAFVSGILYFVTSGALIKQVWAFAAGVMSPVAAIILCMDCWKIRAEKIRQMSRGRAIAESATYVVVGALISIIGGIFIAAILGSIEFFMEYSLYRGVKATFVLPVVITIIAYLQRFPLWHGRKLETWEDWKYFLRSFFTMDIKMYAIIVAAVLAFAAWVYVGRSGHTAGVPVPQFELALRRFLEDTMFARPREKEFFIGYPAFMLAGYMLLRKWPMVLHFICTVGGVIAIGSMVETFAHIRTPVIMSIVRGGGGLVLGILFGILAIIVVEVGARISRSLFRREG